MPGTSRPSGSPWPARNQRMRLEARSSVSRAVARSCAVCRGRVHAHRGGALRCVGGRARRTDVLADLRGRLRLALRVERDAHARDAADPHRPRGGGRLSRALLQHRRRRAALRRRTRRGRRRRHVGAAGAPVSSDDAGGDARRRAAAGRAGAAAHAARRRRGRDHAAAQLHRAAVRVDDARRPDEGSRGDGMAAEHLAARRAAARQARRAHARAHGTALCAWRLLPSCGRFSSTRRSGSRCAPSAPMRARPHSLACR